MEDLVIRYAVRATVILSPAFRSNRSLQPELPDVLHKLNFTVNPGEKVGILGRTGSGKSTLALSFFRFVEATEGRILVDHVDIAKIGLSDLRSRLTIIPRESPISDSRFYIADFSSSYYVEDPTILSGTLRSTLDVFNEYEDAEIVSNLSPRLSK